jgi:hypothetical protein
MNFANAVIDSGVVQYPLSRSGFTRIDMSHYADISGMF